MSSEKDETLREIIDFAKEYERAEKAVSAIHKHNGEYEDATWHNGRLSAFKTIEKHCKAMLGYGGLMPLKVKNQSEDAKMSDKVREYCPEFNDTIEQMVELYGDDVMKVISMEECAELIQAISKSLRGKPDSRDNLLEEMADVIICLRALRIMYDITPQTLDKWIESKTIRNAKRLKLAKEKSISKENQIS